MTLTETNFRNELADLLEKHKVDTIGILDESDITNTRYFIAVESKHGNMIDLGNYYVTPSEIRATDP